MIGKPEPVIVQQLMQEHQLQPGSAIMFGDRLDTDMLFANSAGIASCLVLTGARVRRTWRAAPADRT